MPNKRRHAKAFPLAATIIIVSLAICFATFGIKALMVKYQVMQGGEKLKRLEHDLTAFNWQNLSLQTRKEQLTSVPELQKRQREGKLPQLVPIDNKFVVNINGQPKIETSPRIEISPKNGVAVNLEEPAEVKK